MERGRNSSDVADHYTCNAFNRLLGLVVYPGKGNRVANVFPVTWLLFLHTRVNRDPIYFPGLSVVC
jgi:hypothetical protein